MVSKEMAATPFPFSLEHLVKIDGAQKEQILDTFRAAFNAEDNFTGVLTDRDTEFYADFHYATVIAALLAGEVNVAKNEEGRIVGVAVWFPPGRAFLDSEDQRKESLSVLFGRFSESLTSWWKTEFLPGYGELATEGLGEGEKLKSWHLQTLAVHPDFQRRAIARALVSRMKLIAGKANVGMCIETGTDKNVEIYEKLGFTLKGEKVFKGATGSFLMRVLYIPAATLVEGLGGCSS